MDDTRLILIDGMAVVYRAFYAIRDMTRADGLATNALYGFIRTLNQARRLLRPTHMLVAFDGGLPAHRVALIPAYKAQRAPMPDALRAQLPLVREYLDRAGITQCRLEGCEADDIIATAVTRARADMTGQVIVSGDKDLFQLVSRTVSISRNGSDEALMTPAAVRAKTGVSPEQIPAWLALTGDTSDNIPGVPGIGSRTAARLLREHGTLKGVWAAAEQDRTGRIAGLLREHRARVEQNLEAVLLKADLDPVPPAAQTRLAQIDPVPLIAFYKSMEFHQLERQLREPQLDLDNCG